jgi:tetratricopeptide (TPR) repeat protein
MPQGSGPRRRPTNTTYDGRRQERGPARRSADKRTSDRRPPDGRTQEQRTADQARYDGPEIPEEVTGKELDRSVLDQLRGLPEKLAARVGRHLAAAGLVIDEDPETAYQHTLAARARASRIAVVREACGEAAYAAGHFAEALSELRAAKRMNGSPEYLPIMADCERALGRPERALTLAKSPAVEKLAQDQRVEMTIVEAGARFELGETQGALRTLENARVQSASREPWVVRLRYAYADLLEKAGRTEDALEWFHRTAAIDGQELTDAAERVSRLEAATEA